MILLLRQVLFLLIDVTKNQFQAEFGREESVADETDDITFVTISSAAASLEVHELSASEATDVMNSSVNGIDIIDLNVSAHDYDIEDVSHDTVETLLEDIASLSTLGSFHEENWTPTATPIVHKLHQIRQFLRQSLRGLFHPLAQPTLVVSSPRKQASRSLLFKF